MIDNFRGKYFFLSNFYTKSSFIFDGIQFDSAEAAFQACKTNSLIIARSFATLSPNNAKAKGRKVRLVKDWEAFKEGCMYMILKAKFAKANMAKALDKTGDEELVENNTWDDKYWGICNGVGKNRLGIILMVVRDENRKILNSPHMDEQLKNSIEKCKTLISLNSGCYWR